MSPRLLLAIDGWAENGQLLTALGEVHSTKVTFSPAPYSLDSDLPPSTLGVFAHAVAGHAVSC